MKILYSIDRFAQDGFKFDEGLFLNINDQIILKLKDYCDLNDMIEELNLIKTELESKTMLTDTKQILKL